MIKIFTRFISYSNNRVAFFYFNKMFKNTVTITMFCFAFVLLNQCRSKKNNQHPLENHYDTINEINLSKQEIGSFPEHYLKYRNITTLNMSGLKLNDTVLHKVIKAYPKLESLVLDDCDLVRLPMNIDSLKNLKLLSLVNNKNLKVLPSTNILKYLNIKGCTSITNFEKIATYKNLNYLNISDTYFDTKNMALLNLENLEYLNISFTKIENISISKTLYPKLIELDIRNTKITDVINIKKSFPKLKILYTNNDSIKEQLKQTKLVKPYF